MKLQGDLYLHHEQKDPLGTYHLPEPCDDGPDSRPGLLD